MAGSNSTRKRILYAAEKIMSEKGRAATIGEIAAKANVFDSVIYHYFENKEDLLFSVAEERIKESLDELAHQLQGIREPVSRLSKLIWWQLHRHDTQKNFSNIVLFQCRSRHDFYAHRAFGRIQQIRQVFMEIIMDGMDEGVFRQDLKIPAIRDIIFGLMDLECIMCLAAHETEQAHSDLDDIMDIVLPILTGKHSSSRNHLNKSHRILKAAENVFAQKGYEYSTIKDISKLAEVADGTVYKYFNNKEDLLFSVIEEGFQFSSLKEGFQEHLNSIKGDVENRAPLAKLGRFIRYHFLIYLTQPSLARVFVLHGIFNRRFYSSSAYSSFKEYMEGVYSVLDEGKADGTIRPEVNNRIFRNLVLGAFSHLALRWVFSENESQFDKMKEINEVVTLLTRAVAREKVSNQ